MRTVSSRRWTAGDPDAPSYIPQALPVGKVQTRCSWCGRLVCSGPLLDGLESHGIHEKCRREIR